MNNQYQIVYTPTIAKNYHKLPVTIKKKAEIKLEFFRQNPFDPKLKTHKLVGKLANYWSFSIDIRHRIIFRFVPKVGILFVDVGTHSVYK